MASIDDLTTLIADELTLYSAEVAQEVKQACKDVSTEMMENIKRDSPKNTGKYAKGWRVKVESEDANHINVTTYNKTSYQLTHLLEYGHSKQNGGRVSGKAHIRPNEEKAIQKLTERIEKAVKGE